MSECVITNNNIFSLDHINSEASTLIYRRDSQSYNTGMIIDLLLNYKNILPKLENIYIHISGTKVWSHDMKMFECLYFLMMDEQIKNVIISNGKYNIKKINDKFILEMPYTFGMSIPDNVNEITLFYNDDDDITSLYFNFILFKDLPLTLKKINFRICPNDIDNIGKITINFFDIAQKIPFGTEINLIISGDGKIIELTNALIDQKITIFYGPRIIIDDELKKSNFDFLEIQYFK